MNDVLEKYKIKFEVVTEQGRTELRIISLVIKNFQGYMVQLHPEFLEEEVLLQIENAMGGQSFDNDGGGNYDFLEIGAETSYFYSNYINKNDWFGIPTEDLKEILIAYLKWIKSNRLEKYI